MTTQKRAQVFVFLVTKPLQPEKFLVAPDLKESCFRKLTSSHHLKNGRTASWLTYCFITVQQLFNSKQTLKKMTEEWKRETLAWIRAARPARIPTKLPKQKGSMRDGSRKLYPMSKKAVETVVKDRWSINQGSILSRTLFSALSHCEVGFSFSSSSVSWWTKKSHRKKRSTKSSRKAIRMIPLP